MNIVVNLMHLNVPWLLAHSTLQSLASKRFWLCWLTSVLAVWPDAPYCLCALSLPAHLDGHRTGVLLAADRAPVIWAGASYSNKCRKINSTISSSNVFTTFSGPNLAFLGQVQTDSSLSEPGEPRLRIALSCRRTHCIRTLYPHSLESGVQSE